MSYPYSPYAPQHHAPYAPYPAEQYAHDVHSGHDARYYSSPQQYSSPYMDSARPSPYPMLHKDNSYASEISEGTVAERSFHTTPDPGPTSDPDSGGCLRNLLPDSLACRLYLLVVLLETITDLAIEADVLLLVERNTKSPNSTTEDLKVTRLPTYLVVFGLAHLFQLLLALDAVHARNTLQFIFLIVFNGLLLLTAVVQKTEILEAVPGSMSGVSHIPVGVLTTIPAIVIAVAEIAYIALGWKIYTEFGWSVYKRLGADRSVKRMYMHFQIFICLVKFDVFFWLGFSVQWLFLVLQPTTGPEYYITIAALPFCLALLLVGHLAAKYERKWAMSIFMCGCVAAFIYFTYKLYKIIRFRNDADLRPVFKTLTVFSALAVVLILITFIWACIVMKNFDRGLKTRVASSHQKAASSVHLGRQKTLRMSHFELNSTRRLSID